MVGSRTQAAQRDDLAEIERTLNLGGPGAVADDEAAMQFDAESTVASARLACDPPLGRFQLSVYFVIVFGVVLLACERPQMTTPQRQSLEAFMVMNNIAWFGQLAYMMYAYGFRGFLKDKLNAFDLAMAGAVVLEFFWNVAAENKNETYRVFRILRLAYVLRILVLARIGRVRRMNSPEMDLPRLVGVVSNASVWLLHAFLLLLFLCYIWAVLGMVVFGNNVYVLFGEAQAYWAWYNIDYQDETQSEDTVCDAPLGCRGRFNFDSFGMAFMSVFLIISLDDWNSRGARVLSVKGSRAFGGASRPPELVDVVSRTGRGHAAARGRVAGTPRLKDGSRRRTIWIFCGRATARTRRLAGTCTRRSAGAGRCGRPSATS